MVGVPGSATRGINLTFRRNFGPSDEIEWEELTNLIGNITLTDTPDSVKWALEKSGDFSTYIMN